jgi:hypothetical protein
MRDFDHTPTGLVKKVRRGGPDRRRTPCGSGQVYRDEVTAMLFTLADIKIGIRRIIHLLENENDGEEEAQEDDG